MIKTFVDLQQAIEKALKSNPIKLFVKDKVYWDYVGRVTTPEPESIYVSLDGEVASVKEGDGNSYLIDLPVIYNCTRQYILTLINEIKESIK